MKNNTNETMRTELTHEELWERFNVPDYEKQLEYVETWANDLNYLVSTQEAKQYIEEMKTHYFLVIALIKYIDDFRNKYIVDITFLHKLMQHYNIDIDYYISLQMELNIIFGLSIPNSLDSIDEETEYLKSETHISDEEIRVATNDAIESDFDSIREFMLNDVDKKYVVYYDE